MFWKKKEKIIDTVAITDENFDELVTRSELPVFLDFWAPWCGPCQVLGPIVDELATEFKDRVVVGKINVDKNPGLGQHFKVKSIPTMMFVKNGQLVERMAGMVPKPNLQEMLIDLVALEVPGIVNKDEEE
jgi:thioredoxin 1